MTTVGLLAGDSSAAPPDDDDEPAVASPMEAAPAPRMKMRMSYDFGADSISGEMMGATPGGAQDISYARDQVLAGEIPHAKTFTPEGLFSEHDLPLAGQSSCGQMICVEGEATRGSLLAQPEVRYLAQLGFTSGIKAKDFKREPLNLIAVVDTSGSMSGEPHRLVRESLSAVVDQLGPNDQLGIVLYDSTAHVVLEPTPLKRKADVKAGIASITSGGSTAMEEGLRVGFELAKRSSKRFKGNTRVMLFTDERPNVGATDAKSFMGMARKASKSGIGLTTIGVSTHFGAELATSISSVRGGNLFFFPNVGDMLAVFEDEFDTMVTELAYDMKLRVQPAKGMKIAGVYGIPGDMLEWKGGGSIELGIETIFASKKKGAIYVAFAPADDDHLPRASLADGVTVGSTTVSYTSKANRHETDSADFDLVSLASASPGLTRGMLLVDQATAMKKAVTLHNQDNNQEDAYQLIRGLATKYRRNHDKELAKERELVFALEQTFAEKSGHQGEGGPTGRQIDEVSGLPVGKPLTRARP